MMSAVLPACDAHGPPLLTAVLPPLPPRFFRALPLPRKGCVRLGGPIIFAVATGRKAAGHGLSLQAR